MEEDAVVEEPVDVVVVDVRIMAEDFMTLKMRLLVVDAVVRLIEKNMDMDVGGVNVGVVELAMLIGSGLFMLLKMVTTTTNSMLFWAFRIKRLEASYVSGWRKVVYKDYQKAELATSNWQMTCKPSLEISCYNSFSPPSPRLVRNWRFASHTRQFQTIARHLQNQVITTKIAGKDSNVPYVPTQSSDVFNTPHGWST